MTIEEVEVSPPRKGEVRVKILFTGICHTYVIYRIDGTLL